MCDVSCCVVSLCRASQVNKDWYHASIQPKLWEKFCRLVESAWFRLLCLSTQIMLRVSTSHADQVFVALVD